MTQLQATSSHLVEPSVAKTPRGKTSQAGVAFEEWISVSLDVFKGIFIIFMLCEHTRSSLGMGMGASERIMQFISQVACALDMTCFSTAYGFGCYRAYLTNSKNRTPAEQLKRLCRSVGLIIVASWFCNFSFEMAVLRKPITFTVLRKILTFEIVYWDFLATFPAMLLVAFLTTKPLMAMAASAGKTSIKRILIFIVLLGWPLLTPRLALDTCKSPIEIYATLFIGCANRTMGAMRFSALTYMFFFNFGCIVSLLTLEYSRSADRAFSLPTVREVIKSPTWLGFLALFLLELYFAYPLFGQYNRSWEYLNWNGYRRFPMTAPLILGWGFMSQSVGIFALTITSLCNKVSGSSSMITRAGKTIISVLEHFGANVLLYLTISNIVIHGFFHVDWTRYFKPSSDKKKDSSLYTNFQWELMVVVVAIGQILLTRLIVYLIRTSRK